MDKTVQDSMNELVEKSFNAGVQSVIMLLDALIKDNGHPDPETLRHWLATVLAHQSKGKNGVLE